MSGLVRVIWTANGEVVKDETVPHALASVEQLADAVQVVSTPVGVKLEVRFEFDPPLVAPPAQELET